MTPEDRFQKALLIGAKASPFSGPVTVLINGNAIEVPRCQVDVGTNKSKHDEFGIEQVQTITAHVPKSLVRLRPDEGRDAIRYGETDYKIVNVEGSAAYSPFWVIDGEAPL
jgi:hypothetical protein